MLSLPPEQTPRQRVSSCAYRKPSEMANSSQLAVELPTARHAASTAPLPSTAMALLSRPWDASAVLSLLSARKPAVKFASAIRWTGSSAPRRRLLAPVFALRWIPAAAAAPSRKTRLRRTAFACARALAKASNLPRSHLDLSVGMTKSQSKKPKQRETAPVPAALTTSLSRLHPSRTILPNRAAPPTSPPSRLSPTLDALTLAAPRLSLSKNPLPRSAAPDLVAPGTSVSTTMVPRRLRLTKRPSMPLALVRAASHRSRISSRLQRLVVRTLAARKSDRPALRALAPMPAAPLLRLITGWRLRRPRFRPSPT